MKLMINGQLVDATPEQEWQVNTFQAQAMRQPWLYEMKLQEAIDFKATEKDYGSGVLCASYVTSTNPKWAAEAQAFVAWRDEAFNYAYNYLARVQDGSIANPSIEDFLTGMPELIWPTTEG